MRDPGEEEKDSALQAASRKPSQQAPGEEKARLGREQMIVTEFSYVLPNLLPRQSHLFLLFLS
jgi:hypothetical protein